MHRFPCFPPSRRGGVCGMPAFAVLPTLACLTAVGPADADSPVYLEWFETRWETVEYRVPDFFMAGYRSVWLPPPSKCADPSSAGYDPFDRFDLGSPGAETAYGTQAKLRALVDELHQANGLVYFDWVMNHNSGRDASSGFYNAGGYPGFVMRIGADFWGDFHDGTSQSADPQAPNYDLWTGDLFGLIDIAQEKNYQYIRHPIDGSDPQNLHAGTIFNRPDPSNRRFYPDNNPATGTSMTFVNPALGPQSITVWQFNTADPMSGVPVAENATGLLMRATQYMVDVMHADGFRLDAAKHIPQWFWNQYFDTAVFNRRVTPSGARVTPFSFGEIADNNGFVQTYTRKDGFGNRDALDLNGAAALRGILNAQGLSSWQDVLSSHLDNVDDGFNNGTLGVNHIYSQDNGASGTGSAPPPLPGPDKYALPQHCYLLFRTGPPIVYHNSRQFIDLYTTRGFWPREGEPTALGQGGTDLTRLVQLSNGYARGLFVPINNTDPVNQSLDDVLVFERRRDNGGGSVIGNVLVAVNDSYSNGVQQRSVVVSYAPGTRLHELTGNHGDPLVDPNGEIPELLTVDANSRVLITVPNNTNANGVAHHKGYVVYGVAAPSGTLDVLTPSSTLAPDAGTVPAYSRRLTPVDVISDPSFTLRLRTSKTDPSDGNWDDFAAFRIDQGFRDFNANGSPDFSAGDAYLPGYENFLTTNQSLFANPGNAQGLYQQTIDTSLLSEGYHYISVVCFRHRPSNTDPIFTEFRKVIYVDRSSPSVALPDAGASLVNPSITFRAVAADRTTTMVHILLNVPVGTDPLTLIGPSNQATKYDRFEWRRLLNGLHPCTNTVTIVAHEITGRASVVTATVDVKACPADLNCDGSVTVQDIFTFLAAFFSHDPRADFNKSGSITVQDVFDFLVAWFGECVV